MKRQRLRYKSLKSLRWLGLFLCGVLLWSFAPESWFGQPDLRLVHHLTGEVVHGHLNGTSKGKPISIDESFLEPGDIILCHNPHGGYGYWTHAVIFVGQDIVVDSNDFARGTIAKKLSSYRTYQEIAAARVNAAPQVRYQAARGAVAAIGKPYDPFSSLNDVHTEYCSKLIWQVYNQQGLNLTPEHHWVVPDDLVHSPKVKILYKWGASK